MAIASIGAPTLPFPSPAQAQPAQSQNPVLSDKQQQVVGLIEAAGAVTPPANSAGGISIRV